MLKVLQKANIYHFIWREVNTVQQVANRFIYKLLKMRRKNAKKIPDQAGFTPAANEQLVYVVEVLQNKTKDVAVGPSVWSLSSDIIWVIHNKTITIITFTSCQCQYFTGHVFNLAELWPQNLVKIRGVNITVAHTATQYCSVSHH